MMCKRQYIKYFVLAFGFISFSLAVCVGVLFWGNPQWSKYIYIFQKYKLGRYNNDYDVPPAGFVGTWIVWGSRGRIKHAIHFCDKKNGPSSITTIKYMDDRDLIFNALFMV